MDKMTDILKNEARFVILIGTIIVAITLAFSSLQTKQAVSDERLGHIQTDVNQIKTNHLTHIEASIRSIETRIQALELSQK